MIVALDESGDFSPESNKIHFFVAVHLPQLNDVLEKRSGQFADWEKSIPSTFKNNKGEIKGSSLTEDLLQTFMEQVLFLEPFPLFTGIGVIPSENSSEVVKKHKAINLAGINDGILNYKKLGRDRPANLYRDFANWLRKLNYQKYLKIFTLGNCIHEALISSVGHAITGAYDDELVHLRLKIDRDFIKGRQTTSFWRELLRNQLYNLSLTEPMPLLDTWKETGHPFLTLYYKNGDLDLNRLYTERCDFVLSNDHFEIRIADIIAIILSRYYNRKKCLKHFDILKHFHTGNNVLKIIALKDFSFEDHFERLPPNPWL